MPKWRIIWTIVAHSNLGTKKVSKTEGNEDQPHDKPPGPVSVSLLLQGICRNYVRLTNKPRDTLDMQQASVTCAPGTRASLAACLCRKGHTKIAFELIERIGNVAFLMNRNPAAIPWDRIVLPVTAPNCSLRARLCQGLAVVLGAIFLSIPLAAKDVSLTAIELYSGTNGPAYVQITDVLINGKIELRSCGATTKIDKSAYGELKKVALEPGATLEYGNDGILTLTKDASSSCVVPTNVKFDKNVALSLADLAARAALQAKVLPTAAGATDALPPLKPGVKIVFVTAPDVELAEYLRAERASTISWWQDYLSNHPSTSHTAQAKKSLTSLLVKDGQNSLQAYRNSPPNPPAPNQDLTNAKLRADQALAVVPGDSAAAGLNNEVGTELEKLTDQGRNEIQVYKKALSEHTPGYRHLTTAERLADAIVAVDPHFAPGLAFQTEANTQANALESSLHLAESLVAAKRFDDGLAAVAAYRSFAPGIPRIAAVVNATYKYHLGCGQDLANAQDWEGAVKEFQKASGMEQTQEVAAALKGAQDAWEAAKNKNGANAALQQSQAFGQQHQYIQAYDVLDDLPPPERALVSDQLQQLAPVYIQSASDAAKQIQRAHDPIRGLADETEIVRAYGYLQKAYTLNGDLNRKDRIDDLGDKLSDYYLQQATRYLEKPLASGAGLAWSYLQKAVPYKAANLDAVRDEMTRAGAAYQMRSKLSIRVEFRDQTSRRDSEGFASQLADAIATGLETSGLPVRVIRPSETPAFEPNFQLIGDVIEHRRTMVPTSQPKDSKYRAGEQEIPNDAWNQANRAYEAADLELQGDQSALSAAIARGKKKQIDEQNDKVVPAQKKVADAHAALDAIPKTVPADIIKPYTYTEKTIALGAVVQLQYRINDSLGSPVEGSHPVSRQVNQKSVILENVKPEDTEGVKTQGTVPDDIQFLTDVENSARDELIKAVKESVAGLPQKILEQALKQVQDGDLDGAAESYILYLNSTPSTETSQRRTAERFLQEQYNIQPAAIPSS